MKFAWGVVAFAGILAGCSGGSQSTLTPSAGVSAPFFVLQPGTLPMRAYKSATVTPDRRRHETLAYVANYYSNDVADFRFPKGEPLGGAISAHAPAGMCSRTSQGTFWMTISGTAKVEEFKAGGASPLKTLHTKDDPTGCSLDASSGDMAVSSINGVEIFKSASGSGKQLTDGIYETYFVGYDGSGNLFVDGRTAGDDFAFAELPTGASTFHQVSVPNTVEYPGGVQWDGTYITVGDQEGQAIYRYSVSGSSATLKGTVAYSDAKDCADGDIYKGYYLCPDAGDENAKVYAYPAGGAPLDTWTQGFDLPVSAIVVEK